LRSFKQSIQWIKEGVPVMAFPEGRRSPDGRLLEFKGGLFAIAVKTGVPIVPITLSHTHAVMPGSCLFPVQPGGGKLHVHVHPAIEVEGKTEEDLSRLVRECFLETLPKDQHPINNAVDKKVSVPKLIEA
jgi:1-acyl-sn-glycerol-3-phosphate acyltransferase